MTDPRRAIIVIPAYEPTGQLIDIVEQISADGRPIIVVDDGSSPECKATFDLVAAYPHVALLAHAVNLGKGQALKTAINHVLLHCGPDTAGIVTADADGQHLPDDIRRVAARLESHRSDEAVLVLGCRSFTARVPLRNRFGNVLTRGIFRLLIGRAVADTQTGLRGIARVLLPELLQIEAGRYEYELEVLVRAAARHATFEEVPISTVYGTFAKSHFNPLRDSLRIYFVFIRFLSLSLITAAIDYSVFAIAFGARHNILLATMMARAVAGTFNFTANRTVVFKSRQGVWFEALKYATLLIALMSVSYGLITAMVNVLGFGVYTSKVLAEGTLFAASFAIQRTVVFSGR
jgi:glycosyltransferase involved in cell wall biosynthesis